MDKHQSVAFVAIWKSKSSEYAASPKEQQETSALIEEAFATARTRGVRMYGRYGCRWSTENQYFTFWLSPSFEVLEHVMDKLESAGDFKFAESQHILGFPMHDEDMIDKAYLPEGGPDAERPIGFFAMWRRTDAYYNAGKDAWDLSDKGVRDAFEYARVNGVRMLGRYDCRWSTEWEYFTFWQVPNLEVLEATMEQLESAGDFWFAESHHIIGILEPYYRFGRELVIDESRAEGGY